MGKRTGLIRRGKGYTLRVVVPKTLWATFSPIWDRENPGTRKRRQGAEIRQLWIVLGEVDRRKAVEMANLKQVWLDGLFREAATGSQSNAVDVSMTAPSQEAIHRVVKSYFHKLELSHRPVPFDNFEREDQKEAAIEEAGGIHGTPLHDRSVQLVANRLASESRLSFDGHPLLRSQMVEAVKSAMDEHASREVDRLSLQPISNGHPLFANIGPDRPPPRTLTLGEAIETYKAAPERLNRSKKTKAAYEFRLAAWADLLGTSKPVSAIARAEIKLARDTLMAVPANAVKRWPGQPLAKIAELARRDSLEPMHSKSVKLYLDALASLLKWLVDEGELLTNPATGIGAPGTPHGSVDVARRPLTVSDLRKLFNAGVYAESAPARGWQFWLPLLGVFHGMRLAEILGLQAADVESRDGVPVFVIRPNAGRSLKTVQSARLVPIHPVIQKLGFIEWAGRQPKGGCLFTDLPGDATDPVNAAQKSMARFFRATFPDDKAVVFHSLRHTWTDAAREAYIPQNILERLGGWKPQGASAMHGYGDGYRPSSLAAEIAKIKFEGLDLTHLSQSSVKQ